MRQHTALLIAAGLTAFCLIVVGGLGWNLLQPPAAPAPAPLAALAADPGQDNAAAEPGLSQEQATIYQQALQEARAQLEEANRRLAVANAQLRLAQEQAAAPPPAPTDSPTPPAPPAYPVSPDRAAMIAQTVAPGATPNGVPDLVSYQGRLAYEVAFAAGTVYVDATSGQILYSGIAAPSPPAAKRPAPEQENTNQGGDD